MLKVTIHNDHHLAGMGGHQQNLFTKCKQSSVLVHKLN